MAQLVVRNLPDDLVKALEQRAANTIGVPSRSIARYSRRRSAVRVAVVWPRCWRPCRMSVRIRIMFVGRPIGEAERIPG